MIYIDPPYGIKYDSNFQQRVDSPKNDEKDAADDVLAIKAFRDTWALGVHSYLSYLQERLYLCRELLSDAGSIFVQISDENVHRVVALMDEVFGAENKRPLISFAKTSGQESNSLATVCGYLVWYAKDGASAKYRQLYQGEIRPNTALKSEAARLWCEKMSGTKYGQWRYLFVQQRKLEAALVSGVRSLAELAESLVVARPEPQLRLISLEDERVKREAFKTLLPLYSLRAAAGYFGNSEPVEPESWVEADGLGKLDERMFVCRAVGRSMEPTIHNGDYIVFRAKPVGTRQAKIVLAQYRGSADPDTGGAFTVKRYSSEKEASDDGGWRHTRVVLLPTKPEYSPIVLSTRDAESVQVVGEFVTVLRGT